MVGGRNGGKNYPFLVPPGRKNWKNDQKRESKKADDLNGQCMRRMGKKTEGHQQKSA